MAPKVTGCQRIERWSWQTRQQAMPPIFMATPMSSAPRSRSSWTDATHFHFLAAPTKEDTHDATADAEVAVYTSHLKLAPSERQVAIRAADALALPHACPAGSEAEVNGV